MLLIMPLGMSKTVINVARWPGMRSPPVRSTHKCRMRLRSGGIKWRGNTEKILVNGPLRATACNYGNCIAKTN